MGHYLIRWQLTPVSTATLVAAPQLRSSTARLLADAFGGKLESYYFSLGEWDGMLVAEFPDNKTATAYSMAATATGAFTRFETTVLLDPDEGEQAMQMAHDTKSLYRPPNR